jgi:hypothetical protein
LELWGGKKKNWWVLMVLAPIRSMKWEMSVP